MLLLTWHGTLVCLRPEGGGLVQCALPLPQDAPPPIEVDTDAMFAEGPPRPHPQLGLVVMRPVPGDRGLSLARYGRYLCAERGDPSMEFNRSAVAPWERFMPIDASDAALLGHILGGRWIVRSTRAVLARDDVALAEDFRLHIGGTVLDLERSLAGQVLGPEQAGRTAPEILRLPGSGEAVELVLAGPRSSVLLHTETWPVRARRTAEIVVLAGHRQMLRHEPEQEVFETDTRFLLDRGLSGVEDLFEEMRERAGARRSPGQGAPERAPVIARQRVVSLGTSCITACLLRDLDLLGTPMPFDWLTTTPAMIRHCIETDFDVLLDRSQYRSLTGLGRPGEPERGCDHAFYAREYGVHRVFNHNDPTDEADYRYTVACVDRWRDLMASDAPKLLVQIREHSQATRDDFEALATLLDKRARGAALLQIAVQQPDRRLAMPLFGIPRRQGAHLLCRLQPTSQLGGEAFHAEIDNAHVADFIAAHAGRASASQIVLDGDRAALQAGMRRFSQDRPSMGPVPEKNEERDQGTRAHLAECAQLALNRFLEKVSIPRRYRFVDADGTPRMPRLPNQACEVSQLGHHTTFRLNFARNDPWTFLNRGLPLIYLLDGINGSAPPPQATFLAEFGDEAYRPRSVGFSSAQPDTCLIPDSDFVGTGGYDDLRVRVQAYTTPWADRAATVFWRGATTGRRRHTPPPVDATDDFTWLPRLDVCRRAAASPLAAHLDFGISKICQIGEPHLIARIEKSGLCRSPVSRDAFLGHKAILVIDGNTNAWSALFCALLTGACVMIVQSPGGYRQWYYDALQPGVHYLPVASDLHDLDDQVAWLLAHDAAAREIGQAGQALAFAMTFERVMEDAVLRLRRWLAV